MVKDVIFSGVKKVGICGISVWFHIISEVLAECLRVF